MEEETESHALKEAEKPPRISNLNKKTQEMPRGEFWKGGRWDSSGPREGTRTDGSEGEPTSAQENLLRKAIHGQNGSLEGQACSLRGLQTRSILVRNLQQ